jgi:acetylornithine/N-succinyldiaminopimelate aminotransferase
MEKITNESFHKRDKENYLQTFRRYPLVLERGEGCFVWDVEGNKYLDVLAGIAVNNVGHSHPTVVKAIQDQAAKLVHISNFYLSKPQVELTEKLAEISEMDRVFFGNSGAEAVEGAIKLARKYAFKNGRGGTIISMEKSFHGRTLATIATGKEKMQHGFGPIPHGFKKVPFNDFDALKAEITEEVAGIIIEPIQGEGGINPVEIEYVKQVRTLCDEHNMSLIFDEIQCGMGRTGKWFAKEHYGVEPDIMTSAKGLGGGVPIGAFMAKEKTASAIDFGDHGTTFGGNPLVCASALATISVIEEEDLLENATEMGEWFKEAIEAENLPGYKRFKGKGLMIGLEFDFETKPLVAKMMEHNVLANATADNILRIVPPLNIGYKELQILIDVIKLSIKSLKNN